MQPRWFYPLLTILAILCLTTLISAQAEMKLPETDFDFGYVPADSRVSHLFWIKSVGTDTLKILEIKPGCGCTRAPVKKKEIAGGDSTELEIIYSSSRRVGNTVKHPKLVVNTPQSEYNLTIRSTSLREPENSYPVVFKPYRVYVSRAGEIEVDEGKFKIINVSPDVLKLNLVSEPYGYFDFDLPEKIKPGDTAICKLKVKPEKLSEEFFKSFTIEFDDPAKSRFSIPVVRRFIGVEKIESSSK